MLLENGMREPAQSASAFAMNDAKTKHTLLEACFYVCGDERLDVARLECVQIEHPIDGKMIRFSQSRSPVCDSFWLDYAGNRR